MKTTQKEYTARQLVAIMQEMALGVGSPLTWLNYIKNKHNNLAPSGKKDPRRNPNTKRKDPLLAYYTFEDVCMICWARSTSGHSSIHSTKKSGLAIALASINKHAPAMRKAIRRAIRHGKSEENIYSFHPNPSTCPWNHVSVDVIQLVDNVIEAIQRAATSPAYNFRRSEWQ